MSLAVFGFLFGYSHMSGIEGCEGERGRSDG